MQDKGPHAPETDATGDGKVPNPHGQRPLPGFEPEVGIPRDPDKPRTPPIKLPVEPPEGGDKTPPDNGDRIRVPRDPVDPGQPPIKLPVEPPEKGDGNGQDPADRIRVPRDPMKPPPVHRQPRLPGMDDDDPATDGDDKVDNKEPEKSVGGGTLILLDGPLSDAKYLTAKAMGRLIVRMPQIEGTVRVLCQKDIRSHVQRTQKRKTGSSSPGGFAMNWKQNNAIWRMIENKAKEALREGRVVVIEADAIGVKGADWAPGLARDTDARVVQYHVANKAEDAPKFEEQRGIRAYTLTGFDKDSAMLLAQEVAEQAFPTRFEDIIGAPEVTAADVPAAKPEQKNDPAGGFTP